MDEKVMLPCEHGKFGLHNLYFESGELDREPCLGGRVVEIEKKHYAVVNDVIGGWDVSPWDLPVSALQPEEGLFSIGTFMTEEAAGRVARGLDLAAALGVDNE